MPSLNHAIIQGRLYQSFLRHPEYLALMELSLELVPGKCLTPDISVGTFGPMNLRHDVVRISQAPALTVEIVSPSQNLEEIIEKAEFYLANGVKSVWVVLPPLHELTIFLPDGTQQSYHTGVVRDPATGITADLDAVFS